MSRARDVLRDYLDRRPAEARPAPDLSLQEENLRRLLRHAGAARSPSEPFEDRLRQAMVRAGREGRAGTRRRRLGGWPRLSPPSWRLWAPAAALAAAGLVFAWQSHSRRSNVGRPSPVAAIGSRKIATGRTPNTRVPTQGVILTPNTAPLPRIGYVLLSEGELLRQPAGDPGWEPAGSGVALHLGDTLRTGAGAAASVVFLDESISRLGAETTLQYAGEAGPRLKRPSWLRLARGQAWFKIEKGGPPFKVAAPAATAVVVGTSFGVSVGPGGKTTLRVLDGKVELRSAMASVLVPAGMECVALAGHAPQQPVAIARAGSRPGRTSPPRPLHTLPLPEKGQGVKGTDHGKATFSRQPAATPHPSGAPAPGDSSGQPPGSPASSSSGPGEGGARMPISTSR